MDFGAVKTCQGDICAAGDKRHLRVRGSHIPASAALGSSQQGQSCLERENE